MSEKKPAFQSEVEVMGAPELPNSGLRADHHRLREAAFNCFKMGWGNEQICKVTGLVPSFVTKYRHEYEQEQRDKAALTK